MLTKADIDWLKSDLVPALADAVQKKLEKKLNDISTKLDKFVGASNPNVKNKLSMTENTKILRNG